MTLKKLILLFVIGIACYHSAMAGYSVSNFSSDKDSYSVGDSITLTFTYVADEEVWVSMDIYDLKPEWHKAISIREKFPAAPTGSDGIIKFKIVDPNPPAEKYNVKPWMCPGSKTGGFGDRITSAQIQNDFTFLVTGGSSGGGGEDGTIEPTDSTYTPGVEVKGELKKWHKVTLAVSGPFSSEYDDEINPFMDYQVTGIFTKGGKTYKVPGYYAADGNAQETSATSGKVWYVHFTPDETGEWSYTLRFRKGTDVAINDDLEAGEAQPDLDGLTGTFTIGESDKTGRDLRGKGRLEYVGEHYLKFAGNNEYFLKAGPDAPENLLDYVDFDNTPSNAGQSNKIYNKTWKGHLSDWEPGDLTWKDGKGKGLIGAVNYLSKKGLNSISFLTVTGPDGDDRNVFPWISTSKRDRYDCSKLAQWDLFMSYAQLRGMYLHIKTSETENQLLMDNGDCGRYRKLYYRELIARFGYHLAIKWNVGEENGASFYDESKNQDNDQRKACIAYLRDHDPYNNQVVIHNAPSDEEKIYRPLIGNNSKLTGISIQTGWWDVFTQTKKWVDESTAAGVPWVVANDEQNPAKYGVPNDDASGDNYTIHDIRKQTLWGNLMAGGAGVEYYFGYNLPESDLTCEDYRSRDNSWEWCKIALDFFNKYIPYWEMKNDDAKTSNNKTHCFYKENEVYVVSYQDGGSTSLSLGSGKYNVDWYNPRSGGELTEGTRNVEGTVSITAPDNEDWIALVRNVNFNHTPNGEIVPAEDTDPIKPVEMSESYFEEEDGLVVVEMEFAENEYWSVQTEASNYKEDGYLQYDGPDNFGSVNANSQLIYKIKINNPGTYQFRWRTRRGINRTSGDSQNDSWLSINGERFWGARGTTVVELTNRYTKVWIQTDEWSWNCFGDHGENSLQLYARFDNPGFYYVKIAGRSFGHIIDRFMLAKEDKFNTGINDATPTTEPTFDVTYGDPLLIQAVDFESSSIAGYNPAYEDASHQCLAIRADKYPGEFAAAETTFNGEDGIYDIAFTSLLETDGESTYYLYINGKFLGYFQNPETTADYTEYTKKWRHYQLNKGDKIKVVFNSHTNKKIAEGESTAYSRGRWSQVSFTPIYEKSTTDVTIHKDIKGLKIYPNPTTIGGNIRVESDTEGQLYIYNMSGQLVNCKNITSKSELVELSGLKSGIYLVKLFSQDTSKNSKLIIR